MYRRCATSSATSRRSKPSCSRLATPYVSAMLHVAAPPLAMLHAACNVSRCMRCRRRAEWRGVEWRGGVLQSLCSIDGYAGCSEKVRNPDAPRTDELLAQHPRDCARACAVSWHSRCSWVVVGARGTAVSLHSSTETNPHPSVPGRCGTAVGTGGTPKWQRRPRLSCARLPLRPTLVGVPTEAGLFVCLFVRRKSFRRNSNSNPPTK